MFVLCVFFGISFVCFVNKKLSFIVVNVWCIRVVDGWEWNNEIVVVIGGLGGIGRKIMERFVKFGVKVVVFDLMELL